MVFSVTINDITYTYNDGSTSAQPQKIDGLSMYFPDPKEYTTITFAGVLPAAYGLHPDTTVNFPDLDVFVGNRLWLGTPGKKCGRLADFRVTTTANMDENLSSASVPTKKRCCHLFAVTDATIALCFALLVPRCQVIYVSQL
ncbi:MAG: hypothetical protein ACYST6_03050 [Planctomycetota bacterium]